MPSNQQRTILVVTEEQGYEVLLALHYGVVRARSGDGPLELSMECEMEVVLALDPAGEAIDTGV